MEESLSRSNGAVITKDVSVLCTDIALIKQDLGYIKKSVEDIDKKLEGEYPTKSEFDIKFTPIKNIVYGMVTLILTSFIVALIGLVLIK